VSDPSTSSASGKRYVITMGSGRFKDLPTGAALPRVDQDMRQVAELFLEYGYDHVLRGFAEYPTPEHVRATLGQWVGDVELGANDAVVLYFAGHGLVEERDRHYLMCWNSSDQQPAATALPTEDVVRILISTGLRNLLLILDTCYGGAGGADAAGVALRTVARRAGDDRSSTGLWFLSSARARDEAQDGAFVDVLRPAIVAVTERSGQRQRYLDLTDLVGEINLAFRERSPGQRAELIAGLVTGLPPFVLNESYREHLPPAGTDLEVQSRVAAQDVDIAEHFGPRSRGVEFESEQGMYFSGRARALTQLVGWLTAPVEDRAAGSRGRIVTGNPGCGKSAVLGRIVALSRPGYRATLNLDGVDPLTIVPENTVQVAIHARHKRLEEVVSRFAADLGLDIDTPAALLYELSRRDRSAAPIVAVVDALDEAGSGTAADTGGRGEPRRIARELLRPMAEIAGIRLLIGARRELVQILGQGFDLLDLDSPDYADDDDVAGYVAKVLLAADEPDIKTSYRDCPRLAGVVGEAVAERALGVYLVARMAARSLRAAPEPVDTAKVGWMDRLPGEIGEAFDDYLARFEADEDRVRRLLTPLAFAEGQGLPRGELWIRLAAELSGVPTTDADLGWVMKAANSYIAEVTEQGRSVYRLYHQALAEHLRRDPAIDPRTAQQRIVRALVALVPPITGGGRDWFAAHPYVHANLATHAAAADLIEELITDPGFLLASEQLPLLRALPTARSPEARRIRNAYEQVSHHVTDQKPLGERAAYLQLSAHRCGAVQLIERVGQVGVDLPWSTCWAWWSPTGVHRQLRGHEKRVGAVSVGLLDGRPIALTGSSDGTARIWDLTTQRQLGESLGGHEYLTAVAFGEVGEYTLAFTGGDDGKIKVFDMSTGQEFGAPLVGHTNEVKAIALGRLVDADIVVSTSSDGTARVWDLTSRRQLGGSFALHQSGVNDVVLGIVDGRPIAVTCGDDNRARIWDLTTREPVGAPLIGHSAEVSAVAMAQLDGRDIVVTGCADGTVGFWDLTTRQQIGEPLRAHIAMGTFYSRIASIAVISVGAEQFLLTCAVNDAKVWNLRTRRRVGQPLTGHAGEICAAALGVVNEVPTAVTAGGDRTARIWDLTAVNPPTGHTGNTTALATCADGGRRLAITGGEDTTARLWDLVERRQLGNSLEGHSGTVTAVAIGRQGARIVAATGSADTTIRLWDCASQTHLGAPLVGHTNGVTALAFGEYLGKPSIISGSKDGTVRVWDSLTGKQLVSPLTGHRGLIRRLATGIVEGKQVIVVATPDFGYVWQLSESGQSPQRVGALKDSEMTPLGTVFEATVVNGRPVILASGNDNAVRFWDVLSGLETLHRLVGHTDHVRSAAYYPGEGRPTVATTSSDMTLRLWDAANGGLIGRPLPVRDFGGVGVSLYDRNIIVCQNNSMRIWSLTTFLPLDEPIGGIESRITGITFARIDGAAAVVTGDADGTVRFHDLTSGAQLAPQLISTRYVRDATITQDDGHQNIIAGSFLGTIQILDRHDGSLVKTLHGHTGLARLYAFATVLNVDIMISAGMDATLRIWDRATWEPIGEALKGHTAEILAIATGTIDDLPIVASAGSDGTVRLWQLLSGTSLGDALIARDHPIGALALGRQGDNTILVVGDSKGAVQVWDLGSRCFRGALLSPDEEDITALRLARLDNEIVVVVGDSTGRIRIVSLESHSVVLEINLEVVINDLIIDTSGILSAATNLGVITLDLLGSREGRL
jgi:WD40 repeat protein